MMELNLQKNETVPTAAFWVPLVLVLLAIGLRVVKATAWGADVLPNFSPWMALLFAGTLLFPKILRWYAVLLVLLLVDAVMQSSWWFAAPGTALVVYGLFVLAAWAGCRLRSHGQSGLWVVGGTLVASVIFYVATNTVSWMASPAYPAGVGGWVQALTIGLPGFPPSWVFFRNALISDLGFAGMLFLGSRVEVRSRVAVRHLAEA